jgi:hypothetical protein
VWRLLDGAHCSPWKQPQEWPQRSSSTSWSIDLTLGMYICTIVAAWLIAIYREVRGSSRTKHGLPGAERVRWRARHFRHTARFLAQDSQALSPQRRPSKTSLGLFALTISTRDLHHRQHAFRTRRYAPLARAPPPAPAHVLVYTN